MDVLDQICCAIDAQGYWINNQFWPKEVSIASHKLNMSVLCDINMDISDIKEKDKRSNTYVMKFTRLPMDSKDDAYRMYEKPNTHVQVYNGMDVILAMWQWVQTPGRQVVAIKNNQLTTGHLPIRRLFQPNKLQFPSDHQRRCQVRRCQSKGNLEIHL